MTIRTRLADANVVTAALARHLAGASRADGASSGGAA